MFGDIAPVIGDIKLDQISARDIRTTINAITAAGKPTIANDALGYCKQLFNHAIKLDLIAGNPASAFTVRDAGGVEKSKDRALTTSELKQFFDTAKKNPMSFTRDNHLACTLLVCLGVRHTCRTLLAQQGTPGYVAERCLNHKLKGVEGIYDKYDYFEERKIALEKLALTVKNIVSREAQK